MRHLDITFDLETTALTADAAIMQIAAVAWERDAANDPFMVGYDENDFTFVRSIDLRGSFIRGARFDAATAAWWASQSEEAREQVESDLPEKEGDVLDDLRIWIDGLRVQGLETITLWSQGTMDPAVLRMAYVRHGDDPDALLPHTAYRDARTLLLEAALVRAEKIQAQKALGTDTRSFFGDAMPKSIPTPDDILRRPFRAYDLYTPMPAKYGSVSHNPLFDARRTAWNTWEALRWMSNKEQQP